MKTLGVAILGATGSIGCSALAVIDRHPDRFRPVVLTAHRNRRALDRLAERYRPEVAVLTGDEGTGGSESGRAALLEAAVHPRADVVLNAVVGAAGLEPTLLALEAGKRVALANKESLVCGGPLVLEAARRGGGELIPVDSEHSAIFQCLHGASGAEVERIILTASGGPFREWSPEALAAASPADALRHPTWDMGSKVTIDSATLANKALEVIEAHFLFGLPFERIQAVVHPQSVVHSFVEFVDGSVLAQLGFPTMELPIQYAFTYPKRVPGGGRRWDPLATPELGFEPIRTDAFPAFGLGVEAGRAGGTAPAAFNAANEVAVAAYLRGELSFGGISALLQAALAAWSGTPASSLAAVREADLHARRTAETFVRSRAAC